MIVHYFLFSPIPTGLGYSDCGVTICFDTKFKLSVDLVIESDINFWDIPSTI